MDGLDLTMVAGVVALATTPFHVRWKIAATKESDSNRKLTDLKIEDLELKLHPTRKPKRHKKSRSQ